ncbi:MAG TPA: hypothetical protein HPP80_03075 [Rhodospirillaceae bacterium]|nr:hypothetical protein [Rhodospirillaceae bacterium]
MKAASDPTNFDMDIVHGLALVIGPDSLKEGSTVIRPSFLWDLIKTRFDAIPANRSEADYKSHLSNRIDLILAMEQALESGDLWENEVHPRAWWRDFWQAKGVVVPEDPL